MSRLDTSMGGKGGAFPDTPWSTVLSSDRNSADREARLSELCSHYWRPVYTYIRAAWGKSIEDAKDLTQCFFCHVLEDDVVFRHDKRFGRFRSFLKVSLKNFLSNAHRDQNRLKRGGGKIVVPLDMIDVEDARGEGSPEEQFDQQWARDVIGQCIVGMKEHFEKAGKGIYFQVYERYDLFPADGQRPTYPSLAKDLNISVDDVKNYLTAARSKFHRLLAEQVSQYVDSREELENELVELFSGLGSA